MILTLETQENPWRAGHSTDLWAPPWRFSLSRRGTARSPAFIMSSWASDAAVLGSRLKNLWSDVLPSSTDTTLSLCVSPASWNWQVVGLARQGQFSLLPSQHNPSAPNISQTESSFLKKHKKGLRRDFDCKNGWNRLNSGREVCF